MGPEYCASVQPVGCSGFFLNRLLPNVHTASNNIYRKNFPLPSITWPIRWKRSARS